MALRKVGVIFTAEGHSQYMSQLKQTNQEMRTLATQSKLAVAQLGNNASITDTYSTKMKSMGAQLDVARNRTSMLKDQQKILGDEQKRLPGMIDNATNSYKASNATTKELRKTYTELAEAKGEDAKETLEAEKAYKASLRETNKLKKEMKDLELVYAQNGKELDKLPNSIAKAELAYQNLNNTMQRTHEEFRNSGGNLANVAKSWRDSGENFQKVGGHIQSVGGVISNVGSSLTRNVTVPIVAMGGLALKASMDWETGFAGVMKTNDEVFDSTGNLVYGYGQLENELRSLATTTLPLTHTELAGIAENAGQLGIATQDVVGFTEVIGQLGHTTNLSYDEASTALAQFLNVTGSGTDTVSNLASSIVALGNNTAATEKDILMMSQRWATTGAMIGLTDDQITAMSATLISMGVNVEAGGSALQRFGQKVNSYVLDAGTDLDILAETAGMTATEFASAWENEPVTALEAFLEGLDGVVKEGGNANALLKDLGITSVQEVNALLALAGGHEQLAVALGLSADAYAENTALSDEFAVFAETTAAKVQILKNRLTDIAIEFGGPLADALTSALNAAEPWIERLAEMAEAFADMDEEGQRTILMWVGLAAAAGPVLSIFGSLVTGIGGVVKGFGTAQTVISEAIRLLGKFTTPKSVLDMPGNIGKVTTELGKVPGSATKAGGAASLFSNPWVIAGAVAVGAIASVGIALYNEAQAPHIAHQDAVDATEGKYQEWFDSVVAGSGTIAELNANGVAGAEEMAQAYENASQKIMDANRRLQYGLDSQFGESAWNDTFDPNIEIKWHQSETGMGPMYFLQDLQATLVDTGMIAQSTLDGIRTQYDNAGTMLTNTMTQISSSKLNNEVVTKEWASGQINAVKNVATSTVENLKTVEQARIENVNQQREQRLISQAEADKEIASIESQTQAQINAVNDAQGRIHAILKSASDDRRKLNSEEVTTMMADMMELARITGQSFTEIEGASEVLGQNLEALAGSAGLAFLEAMGIIDRETAIGIAAMTDMEEKTKALNDVLVEYGLIDPDTKEFDIDTETATAELLELTELVENWNNLSLDEKRAQVESRGKEEIDELLELLGVNWESLTPSQKRYYAEAEGGEALENILYLTGEWNRQTDPQTKRLVLETQIDSEAIKGAIEQRDLWNDADFVSLLAEIDTNAPDAHGQIVALINYFSEQQGLPTLQMETETNSEETNQKLADLISAYTGADVGTVLEFLTDTNAGETADEVNEFTEAVGAVSPETTSTFYASAGGAGEKADEVGKWNSTIGETPESKSSGIQTNIFSMALNTIAVLGYNVAVGAMTDKTSTLTTAVPGIVTNTLLVHGWNNAMANSYSKTSTLTTVHRTVRENVGFATGGHIDAYAEGGQIQFAGAFASGGNVPKGYSGIVGEAGAEIFTVTDRGVSITPLNSREKMRGVGGAVEEEVARQLGDSGNGGDTYNFTFNNPIIQDENDTKRLTKQIIKEVNKVIGVQTKNKRKGRVVPS